MELVQGKTTQIIKGTRNHMLHKIIKWIWGYLAQLRNDWQRPESCFQICERCSQVKRKQICPLGPRYNGSCQISAQFIETLFSSPVKVNQASVLGYSEKCSSRVKSIWWFAVQLKQYNESPLKFLVIKITEQAFPFPG